MVFQDKWLIELRPALHEDIALLEESYGVFSDLVGELDLLAQTSPSMEEVGVLTLWFEQGKITLEEIDGIVGVIPLTLCQDVIPEMAVWLH